MRVALEKLAETLKYADPVTSEATRRIESDIRNAMDHITNAASIDVLIHLVKQRNDICRSSKAK